MRRTLITTIALGATALALAAPAQADAAQTLHIGEAKRELGRMLHRSFEPGVQTGSLIAYCGRRARHVVRCDVLVTGADGYAWCGGARIKETWSHYYVRWNLHQRRCELF